MKITLITPSFNHDEFIRRTIDSVLGQVGDFELEYVVLDGGSSDNTVSILQSYGDRLHWTSGRDGGQIAAINTGLKTATGDIVGWINSDDVLLPGALQRVADQFRSVHDCDWLHGGCRIIDRSDNEIRKSITAYKRHCSMRYSRQRLLSKNFICQMTVFWRRRIIGTVGYLDEGLPLAFDYDYWLRLAAVSDPAYVDQTLAAFRWYSTSKSGANYIAQVEEEERIASSHGIGVTNRWRKYFGNRVRIGVYHCLDLLNRSHPVAV